MTRSSSDELIRGYIDEVKSYLPSLKKGIESLEEDSGAGRDLEEIHRLVHTIKGASAMIGIHGLSHIAYQMEETLDEIISGDLKLTDEILQVMRFTLGSFEIYCSDFENKGVNAKQMLKDNILAYRKARNMSLDDEDPVFRELLEKIPEREGGIYLTEQAGTDKGIQTDFSSQTSEMPMGMDQSTDEGLEKMGMESIEESVDGEHDLSDISPDLLASFNEEAAEHLLNLNTSLKRLSERISGSVKPSRSDLEDIRKIRRYVHTIKGSAAIVGVPRIPGFGAKFEDFLDYLFEKAEVISPEIVEVLTEASEYLESIVSDLANWNSTVFQGLTETFTAISGPREISQEKISKPESVRVSESPQISQELADSFHEEAVSHLEDLGQALNALEAGILRNIDIAPMHREIIGRIRRSVHTLKGAASVIGLKNISGFAHEFEDLLDWLFEKAREIGPETVSIIMDASEMLERFVAEPENPREKGVHELKHQFRSLMGTSLVQEDISDEGLGGGEALGPEIDLSGIPGYIEHADGKTDQVDGGDKETTEEDKPSVPFYQPAKTMRIGMDRIDDLVNLSGELLISLSAIEQRMDGLRNTVNELDVSRNRLREIARELELGFEVKSLSRMGSLAGPAMNYAGMAAVASGGGLSDDFRDFDTLELDRYSELNLIIRQLHEFVIDIGSIYTTLSNIHGDFDGSLNRQRVLISELQDKMMRVRMTPMSTITNRLRRTVRETSRKLGKKIRLVVVGEEIELDRMVWEKLTDPFMHILRNAVDHGIEAPALRKALGKPIIGTIRVEATREGNQVVIRISDDGAGLNFDAIRKKAKESGLLDQVDEKTEENLASLIFQPGFSTKGKINVISGRGVGMDVVKENLQDLKGVARVSSKKGNGSCFTLRIPLTLAAIRALLFRVGDGTFAVPLNEVHEIMRISEENLITEPEKAVRIGNEVLPLFFLAKTLGMRKEHEAPKSLDEMIQAAPIILIVECGGKKGGLVVDNLIGQKEIVIKTTGSHLRYVKGISGVTIMGDGRVVPILNLEELLLSDSQARDSGLKPGDASEHPLRIMVVDDSVSVRTVVSRLIEDQGWRAIAAKDGIDALEKLREGKPDLIVLDVEMPRMNGYEFMGVIGTQRAYKDIPVVMLTSRTAAKHRKKAVELGARGFVVKPYDDEEFVDLILELTSG